VKKYDSKGNLVHHKAWLIAKEFMQIHDIDYDDTYLPVVWYKSLWLLLRIAAVNAMSIHQMDFDNAYLNSSLNHEIYMLSSPGFTTKNIILRLNKALYDLKQSGWQWFGTLFQHLSTMGFSAAVFDPCIFISTTLTVVVYVDDLLIIGLDTAVQNFKQLLLQKFKCKDLSPAWYLLGLEISQQDAGLWISQQNYAMWILQWFGFDNCNSWQTPLNPGLFPPWTIDGDDLFNTKTYQQMMGSLNFLIVCTRPDLMFMVMMLSSFNLWPNKKHALCVHQVLCYLKHTANYSLFYHQSADMSVNMYTDALLGSDPDTSCLVSGYVLLYGNDLISWGSKQQSLVAKLSCEAEYVTCSYAVLQLLWMITAVSELNAECQLLTLHCNNEAAQSLVENKKMTSWLKHIAIHYHFVWEKHGILFKICHVSSENNLADICTKLLLCLTHQKLTSAIGIDA
jgi:hypothetical protein